MGARTIVAVWVLVAATAAIAADDTVTGYVFEDLDGDRIRDAGEPGVPGVAVSNGLEVVATDGDGRYELPIRDDTVLFVTKPAGHAVPVDRDNLPQFFYRHFPDGTPDELGLRFAGVDPTGPLPDSVDFPLYVVESRPNYQVVWFADPQPQTAAEIDYIRDDVVAELVGIDAEFGVTVGDIMYDDLSLLPRQNGVIARIGIPWYNVPGNHELNLLARDDQHSRETFMRHFGPTYYSFDAGQVHYVVLDDVQYLGAGVGREQPHPRGAGTYRGRIGATQLDWLRNDLALVPRDRLVIVAMHIPLTSYGHGKKQGRYVEDTAEFLGVLDGRNAAVIAGHMHTTEHHYFDAEDGWGGAEPLHMHILTTVAGSWWSGPFDERGIPVSEQRDGTPNGYHVMSVENDSFSMRYKAASKPVDFQMRIHLDSHFAATSINGMRDYRMGQLGSTVAREALHATRILVNLFDGGPRSTLECAVDDGPWVAMERVAEPDPYFRELWTRNREMFKTWVGPEPSSHLWAVSAPRDLEPGAHTVRIRAVDEYGRTHEGIRVFEVVAATPVD